MPQLSLALQSLIRKLWDRFWSGGISNPLSAIEQITYLLFIKQLDELDLKREQDAEFTGDTFVSRFKGDYYLPQERTRAGELAMPRDVETTVEKELRLAELKRLAIDTSTLRWSHFKQMTVPLGSRAIRVRLCTLHFSIGGNGEVQTIGVCSEALNRDRSTHSTGCVQTSGSALPILLSRIPAHSHFAYRNPLKPFVSSVCFVVNNCFIDLLESLATQQMLPSQFRPPSLVIGHWSFAAFTPRSH
jgi:hypothetical protein